MNAISVSLKQSELARVYSNLRVRDQFDESIELLLVQAEQLEFDQAKLCLKRWESFADADGAHNDREASIANRTATVGEFDGALFLTATGRSAEDAAEMTAIFNTELKTQFQADVTERTRLHGPDAPASMLPRSDAQRRFDALQAIIRRAALVPADAKAPKPLVNIIIDQRSFEEALHARGLGADPVDLPYVDPSLRRSETTTGIAVLPDVAVKAAFTGHVRRVVVNSAGVVINMGRKQRLFTGSAREAVNGCKHHNLTKHRNKYRVERRPDGQIVFYRPDGTPMLPVGQRLPPETEEQLQDRHVKQRLKNFCETRDKQLDADSADAADN